MIRPGKKKQTNPATKKGYQTPAVVRALKIIEFIANKQEASFTEIFSKLGYPKSSTYQILTTLSESGYVRRQGESTKYSLGLKLFELGNRAVARIDIRAEALPVLRELVEQTNETCHLGVLDGTEGVYLTKVEGTRPVRLNSWEGKRLQLHCTAMGKALLAWQPPGKFNELINKIELTPSTDRTITDRRKLVEHLQMVLKQGWALDNQENEVDIRCVAAPILNIEGLVSATISISGLANQFDGAYLVELSQIVRAACEKVSTKIGGG